MRRIARLGILIVGWLAATGAIGNCEFFRPAVPETPNAAPIEPHYETPTLTLETLAKGLVAKNSSNSQDVYLDALAESSAVSVGDGRAFHAFFDPADLALHPTWDPDRDWNKALETTFYNIFISRVGVGNDWQMTWGPYEPAGNETGSDVDSLLHRKYTLVQLVRNGNTVTPSPIAVGVADLYFVKSLIGTTPKWVIARWQDYYPENADPAQVSMGKRRLENRGQ